MLCKDSTIDLIIKRTFPCSVPGGELCGRDDLSPLLHHLFLIFLYLQRNRGSLPPLPLPRPRPSTAVRTNRRWPATPVAVRSHPLAGLGHPREASQGPLTGLRERLLLRLPGISQLGEQPVRGRAVFLHLSLRHPRQISIDKFANKKINSTVHRTYS
jgi:hypothetical protein